MPRDTAIQRGERISPQFGIAENGAHAEAHDVGGDDGLYEEPAQNGLRHEFGLSRADGNHSRADASHAEQNEQQDYQQISREKESDAPVARARLGPEKLVAELNQAADQGGVHRRLV